MLNLFIVDDNPRDLRGVAGLCDWSAYGCRLAGTFGNGVEAMEAAERIRPDLVISDVQMPVMDGLAFGRRLKERFPDVRMVYLSSYDSFSYAQSALKLDAEDYVLKPIRRLEFLETIAQVTKRATQEHRLRREQEEMLEQMRRALPLHQDQFVRELLWGVNGEVDLAALAHRAELLELPIPIDGQFRVIALRLNEADPTKAPALPGYMRFMHYFNRLATGATADPETFVRLLPSSDWRLDLIVGHSKESGDRGLNALDWLMQAEEELENAGPMQISAGISKRGGLGELSSLHSQAVLALEAKTYSDRNPRMIFYEEVDGEEELSGRTARATELQSELKELLYAPEPPELEEWLDRQLGGTGGPIKSSAVKSFMIVLMGTLQQVYDDAGKPVHAGLEHVLKVWGKVDRASAASDLRSELAGLIRMGRAELLDDRTSYNDKIVAGIKSIVSQRYKEALTIQEIADGVFLSLSHANNIFKSKTGQTMFDYLTEFRMEKAKHLLRAPDSKIYDVAEDVGYTSKSHFCLIFKKHVGITPSAYKNSQA